jgi:hypothetical protein
MEDPTPAAVDRLLRDPACRRGRGMEEEIVPVRAFITFARPRGFATTHVEQLADDWVRQLGGERHHVVDPASWVANLL